MRATKFTIFQLLERSEGCCWHFATDLNVRCHGSYRAQSLHLASAPKATRMTHNRSHHFRHNFRGMQRFSDPGIEFMLHVVRLAPIPERIDCAQLTRELLAQQFEGKLG